MTSEQMRHADMTALSIAIQMLFKHLPLARNELAAKIPDLRGEALYQPLTDEQIERLGQALQLLTAT